uniref:Putative tail protein n=1 Tax=viral metagenome TaxID=1070528 RepID=A0A6M3K7P5_9ZZZZ
MNQVFAQQKLHGLNGLNVQAGNAGNFIVINAADIVYRTAAQVLADIGAAASAHVHDGDTLQLDGINSDGAGVGGVWPFTTGIPVSFSQNLIIPDAGTIGSVTTPGTLTISSAGHVAIGGTPDATYPFTIYDTAVPKKPGINFKIDTSSMFQIYVDNTDANAFKIMSGAQLLYQGTIKGTRWIEMDDTQPSGIGTGGVGAGAWIAYVRDANQWFQGSSPGDVAYRAVDHDLLFGTNNGSGIAEFIIKCGGPILIGTATSPTSMTTGIVLINGTAPTTNVENGAAIYAYDIAAGHSAVHIRNENSTFIKLYQQAHITDANVAHGVASWADVDTALNALGTIINTLIVRRENQGFEATA